MADTELSASSSSTTRSSAVSPRRSSWLKTLHLWHWISSALCLLGMLLFSITGITLNHATQIESKPQVTSQNAVLPAKALHELKAAVDAPKLPASTGEWLERTWRIKVPDGVAEWSPEELYVPLPRPGGDAWLRIDLESGAAEYEVTDRGWISYLNDLHKGRNSGTAWNWFIDVFAGLCLLFSITGLLILKFHAVNRPLTWPMVGLGIIIPALLALLFIH
jgi:hypothetical protein